MLKNFSLPLTLLLLGTITSDVYAVPFKIFKNPQYEMTVEALLVQRKGVKKHALVIDSNLASDKCSCFFDGDVMTTTKVMNDFDWEPGLKAAFTYTPSIHRSIEFSLAWVNDWDGERTYKTDADSLSYPFDSSFATTDYNSASKAKGTYESHLWDTEINYWGHYSERGKDYFSLSGIIGLRGFYLGEHFKIAYTKSFDTSSYWTTTKNRILGVQGGGNLQWNPVHHWSWEITTKAGMMADWSWADYWVGDRNNTVVLSSASGSTIDVTYLLDGDLRLFYHHNKTSINLGYRLIGLWGVALAPNQLRDFSGKRNPDGVHDGGKAYYHIVSLGFNFLF